MAPFLQVKRIAMLSVHTCPLAMLGGKKTGGMNVYVRDIAAELGRQGIQVDVFTRSEDECQPRVKHDLGYGARVIHIPAGPEVPVRPPEILNHLDEFVQGVLAFAETENAHYDLIHSHYWLSGLVAGELRTAWENKHGRVIPVIHMFHTLGHMKNQINPNPDERAPQERLDSEYKVIHHIADRLVAATPAEEAQLINLYQADPEKIIVIPPGVDPARFHPQDRRRAKEEIGLPCDGKNIMFVGRIEPLKGIDTLIEAAAILRRHHPAMMAKTCFAIVGGDPWAENPEAEMKRLQALAKELEVSDIVGFLGSKNQNVLPKYYAATDVVVMPSHYESFGMVALEAMAVGTPVIASEVGGLAHLVKDGRTGFHVPPRDPETLANRICVLLSDDFLREQFGQQAAAYAQQYSWEQIACRLFDLYHTLHPRPCDCPVCI
ncbi:MAG: glycosyltransferase [Anaerolineales bacterium]|nr:glycosyltransferase [Anaerolineales bacterium]